MSFATFRLALCGLGLTLAGSLVFAKLPAPAPPTPEEKAKAAEAAAKTAWGNKVADFQLCRSMDRAAVNHFELAKKRGATAAADASAPVCADPGPFAAPAPVQAAAPVAANATAAAAASAPKK